MDLSVGTGRILSYLLKSTHQSTQSFAVPFHVGQDNKSRLGILILEGDLVHLFLMLQNVINPVSIASAI